MKISPGKVVLIDYTLTDDNKEILDTSKGGEPLAYIHGSGQIIPGLEKALDGRQADDALQVNVAPEEGYGLLDEKNVLKIPRDKVNVPKLKEGMRLQMSGQHGPQVVIVTGITDSEVTLDANHPLAGKNLYFDVTVREVRNATPEELSHGHVHGPGGHHH